MKNLFLTVITCAIFGLSSFAQTSWPDSIYTARNASYLTEEERLVVAELNKVRTNPKRYAEEVLIPFLNRFESSSNVYVKEDGSRIMTNEGQAVVRECINVLKRAKPLPMLYPKEGLTKAAKWHAADQRGGRTGHTSSDGSSMSSRISRYGTWDIYCGENISYGCPMAFQIVRQLMVDDGVSSRGHRENILNVKFRFVGLGIDTHARYEYSCTMDFAARYTNK